MSPADFTAAGRLKVTVIDWAALTFSKLRDIRMRKCLRHAVLLIAVSLQGSRAYAHSWYPPECCNGEDCGVVTLLEELDDGQIRVTTESGFAIVPRGFSTRLSPDLRAHACLRPDGPAVEQRGWVVVCLFLPANV
jgi:hypothetical protein